MHFAFKVDGDATYNLMLHDDLNVKAIQASGSTSLEFSNGTDTVAISIGDVDAELDWVVVLINISGTAVTIYVNDSLTPITGTFPSYLPTGAHNLAIADGISVSNFVIGSGVIDISSLEKNYIYDDIVNNEGDLFFEVV